MRTLILLPLLAMLAVPATAADTLQLVRPGDRDMSCPALASEINALAATPVADTAPTPRHRGLGGLARAFGTAMPMLGGAVPGMGGMGGAALMQAASVAGTVGAQSSADTAVASARAEADAAALRDGRRQRLLAIFEDKHC